MDSPASAPLPKSEKSNGSEERTMASYLQALDLLQVLPLALKKRLLAVLRADVEQGEQEERERQQHDRRRSG